MTEIDLTAPRRCYVCEAEKPLSEFSKKKDGKLGRASICKPCQSLKNKAYRAQNGEKLVAHSREWRKTNKTVRSVESKEKSKERMRRRYAEDEAHRAAVAAYAKAYRAENAEKVKEAYREWRAANMAHIRESARLRRIANPEKAKAADKIHRKKYFVDRFLRAAARRAIRGSLPGKTTNEDIFWAHKWQDNCCFYCNRPLSEENKERPIEHIIPVNRGGSNHPYNVVRTCGTCNFSRQDKIAWSEWSPKGPLPAPRFHSTYCQLQLKKAAAEAGIEVEDCGDHLSVAGRKIFVLSSFWMSSRVAPLETLETLKAKHPTAVFFFDHEWRKRKEAILNVVLAKAGVAPSVGARQTEVAAPTTAEAREFIDRWHIQGFAGGSWVLGLKLDEEWVAMAVFRDTKRGYELSRMAFRNHVSGGMSKLVAAFLQIAPDAEKDVFSFCDLRFGDGGGYVAAGFKSTGDNLPVIAFANVTGLYHWWVAKKQNLDRWDFNDEKLSDLENLRVNGVYRITMLPLVKFVLPRQ